MAIYQLMGSKLIADKNKNKNKKKRFRSDIDLGYENMLYLNF